MFFLALAALVGGPRQADAQTIIGDLNNFDTVNDTGGTCYGFEIEIDDIRSTDITYTFDWNHYGVPRIAEDLTDPAHPKVFVRYESTRDATGAFGANGSFTNTAIPSITPPSGHSCTDPTVNEGCEHFGVGYYGTPTTVKYHWLVDNGAGALVYFGSPVSLAKPTWTYTPPAGGAPAQAVAVIPAPAAPIAGREFGEPSWVKVVKTTTHSANPIVLADLVSDDKDGDSKPDWTNGEPDEVETEWRLLQATVAGGGPNEELAGAAEEMGDGSEVVTRRYEFYKYGAALNTIDGETGEAMCSEVQPTIDPADPLYLHGIGDHVAVTDANGDTQYVSCVAQVVVGDYIGAQMAGFAAALPLGVIDHLQEGASGVAYVPRTVVVGGVPPYVVTIPSGSLPPGLTIDAAGVLSGTPTSGGDFPFTVGATDSMDMYVSQAYSLHIAGVAAPQYDLDVFKTGSGSGAVSGNGISCDPICSVHLDQGTSISLTAIQDIGSVFVGWSGACTGTGTCSFALDAAATVTASFTKQWLLTVSRLGTGTGSVNGGPINCGSTCSALVDDGTVSALSATATNGSIFTGWGGDCSGTGSCSPIMTGDRSVTATFVLPTDSFTLTVTLAGTGSVTSSPKGINCGKNCSKAFTVGTTVTLTAKPSKKHTFVGWTGACASSGASPTCTIDMLKPETAGATFN
jgi:hypothetical protein